MRFIKDNIECQNDKELVNFLSVNYQASGMALCVKMPAAKPEELSLIPGTHLPTVGLLPPAFLHSIPTTTTQGINTWTNLRFIFIIFKYVWVCVFGHVDVSTGAQEARSWSSELPGMGVRTKHRPLEEQQVL